MTDILIVGVGGQGTLLASRILGNLAMALGYDVKLSEVHGMAQRGGSVVTHVRFGDKVHSPVIDEGSADIILAFEKLEALRWAGRLKQNGSMFINTQQISPMPVVTGAEQYPADIEERIKVQVPDAVFVDALSLAKQAGSEKAVNTVLIGVLAKNMNVDKQFFIDAIKETVPERLLDVNLIAFEKGYELLNLHPKKL
jgi:indolepyruvate ferredoxin oxidoreductase beta subunit